MFQDKLPRVVVDLGSRRRMATGAMVLINSEDALLQMGTLSYDHIIALAVSVKQSDGERLLQLVKQQLNDEGIQRREVMLHITSEMPRWRQALARIRYLLHTNFPLIAYETYMDENPPSPLAFDQLLDQLDDQFPVSVFNRVVLTDDHDATIMFFYECVLAFAASKWEFAAVASLHAAVFAAGIANSYDVRVTSQVDARNAMWRLAAHRLADAGYYKQSAFCFERIRRREREEEVSSARCELAFVKFLRGNVVESLSVARRCLTHGVSLNISAPSLQVAHDNLVRLAELDASNDDAQCLQQAAAFSGDIEMAQRSAVSPGTVCCQRRVLPSRDDPRATRKRRQQFEFRSRFVEELFHTFNIMGVFLDELGAFNESLRFFHHAEKLCPDDVSLPLRQALAVPVVFPSVAAIDAFYNELHSKIAALEAVTVARHGEKSEQIHSSITGGVLTNEFLAVRPEDATHLQYTITPPTMFIGYQVRGGSES